MTVALYDLHAVPAVIQETLAAWNLLRDLGFEATEIFFFINADCSVGVQLREGDRGMPIRVGKLPEDWTRERGFAQWEEIAANIRQIPQQQLDSLWKRSIARARSPEIVLALLSYGVTPPALVGLSDRGDAAIRKFVDAAAQARGN